MRKLVLTLLFMCALFALIGAYSQAKTDDTQKIDTLSARVITD